MADAEYLPDGGIACERRDAPKGDHSLLGRVADAALCNNRLPRQEQALQRKGRSFFFATSHQQRKNISPQVATRP
jgi:hypothetical protein